MRIAHAGARHVTCYTVYWKAKGAWKTFRAFEMHGKTAYFSSCASRTLHCIHTSCRVLGIAIVHQKNSKIKHHPKVDVLPRSTAAIQGSSVRCNVVLLVALSNV